jgi:hypothetical protein
MTVFTPSFALETDTQNLVDWCEVESVTVYGGRYDTMTQPSPRVMTAQLTNWGTGSSFVPPNIGDNIQLDETNLNVTLFYGFITDITFSYRNFSNGYGVPTFTIMATSHLASIDWNTCTPSINYSLDYAGAQILAMMSDWQCTNRGTVTYNSTTMPQTGGATLGAVNPTDSDNLGDVIRYTAQSAGGVFYERSNGDIYYDRRVDRQNRTAIVLANTDIMSDISFTKSITAIANDATVTRSGTDATASDSTSIGKFGKRAGTRDTRLHLLTDAQTIANSFISAFKSPVWRPDTVTVSLQNPNMTDSVRSAIATVFCGSKVTIPIPSDIGSGTATYYVENFTLQLGKGTLDVSLGLAPVADSV